VANGRTERESRFSTQERAKLIAAAILAVVLVVFALVNTDDANVDFVVTDVDAPLIVVIVVSAVIGGLITALLSWRRRR